ncbi:MAG: glycosyltransferase, partial [Phycisphaeraceae bacterium]|nr:glycosyltransferase [Phycisphaeraceae bacterium]
MRLLHLIDDRAPGPGCVHLAMLSDGLGRLPDIEATVALIGGDRLRQAASAVGIQPDLTLSAPFGGGPFAWPALRHHLRRLGGPDRYDLVHAWTPSALKLAATLLPDTPRLLTVSRLVDDHSARRLRAIIDGSRGRTHVLAGSNTVRRSLCSRGVPEDAVDVLRPGLDFGRVQAGRRDDLREAWNIGPDHRVVAVLGDDPARTHAMPAMLVGGIH